MSLNRNTITLSNSICSKVLNHISNPYIYCIKYVYFGQGNKYLDLMSDIEFFDKYSSLPQKIYEKNFGAEIGLNSVNVLASNRIEDKTKLLLLEDRFTYILRLRYIAYQGVHYVEFWSKMAFLKAENFFLNNLPKLKKVGNELIKLAHFELKSKELFNFENSKLHPNIRSILKSIGCGNGTQDQAHTQMECLLPFKVSPHRLTVQETNIIRLFYQGLLVSEIATYLNVSVRTIENHLMNIKSKLGCNSLNHIIPTLMLKAS